MLIKLNTNFYGAWRGTKGETVDRPDAEALYLIAKKQATPVRTPAPAPAKAK